MAVDTMLHFDEVDVDESDVDMVKLLGETFPLAFEDDSTSNRLDDLIPNRMLTDFVIFDEQSGLNILLEDIEEGKLENIIPVARGLVSPL